MNNKRFRWLWIALAVLIVVGICFTTWRVLPPYVRGHLHILTPRIQGTVTVSDTDGSRTYAFADRGGYGMHVWNLGEGPDTVTVSLFNTNDWHVIHMDFRVEREGTQWNISGKIEADGYGSVTYEDTIPLDDPIEISASCFL